MTDVNEWATFEFQDGGKCPHRNVVRIHLYLDGVERGISLDSIRDFLRWCDAKNKTIQATRYAVKYQPNKDELEKGAYFSRCCGGCNFEHEVCPVRESAKGDHSCRYKQAVIKFTFDYVVHFVPADGTWGVFAEGPHLPTHAIAWFTTEELANQYCTMLGGKA